MQGAENNSQSDLQATSNHLKFLVSHNRNESRQLSSISDSDFGNHQQPCITLSYLFFPFCSFCSFCKIRICQNHRGTHCKFDTCYHDKTKNGRIWRLSECKLWHSLSINHLVYMQMPLNIETVPGQKLQHPIRPERKRPYWFLTHDCSRFAANMLKNMNHSLLHGQFDKNENRISLANHDVTKYGTKVIAWKSADNQIQQPQTPNKKNNICFCQDVEGVEPKKSKQG